MQMSFIYVTLIYSLWSDCWLTNKLKPFWNFSGQHIAARCYHRWWYISSIFFLIVLKFPYSNHVMLSRFKSRPSKFLSTTSSISLTRLWDLVQYIYQYDIFHYGKLYICRVPTSLPCAISRAHGKKQLCRVSTNKHTANSWHTTLAHGKAMCLLCTFF